MVNINVQEAKDKITKIFMNVGVNKDEATIIAQMLVEADQRGVHSHGILCTARYVKLIREGKMRPNMNINVLKDNGVVAVWDGNHSSGQILGYRSMEEAIKKAKEHGIGVVCVKGANHFGALAYYAQMAQRAGMIGTALGTGDSTMAPWGGCEKVIGNNPISVAAPARNEVSPVLDMAMTVVANGKVSNMKRQGATEIPEGWGLDREGVPTTSMKDYYTIPPMAGYKGWGMAVMVDILAGVLFGGGTGDRAKDSADGPSIMMIAMDISAFNDEEKYFSDVDARINELKSSKKAKYSNGILMPGEIEANKFAASEKSGIVEVLLENLDMVNDIAKEMAIEPIAIIK
ncbi:Ldh family oxidoreductase [Bullifex sp.]|uniref:Ldh family oxidoreductase n=1 Tax=Bullifex sp. TaxID=2815808 RepID=UPI002A83449E|nr:Ldh family oxidoreductase [Bullifex sp.]MDY4066537.1 Ldh family oxidoreductase [Bullifex sp.]